MFWMMWGFVVLPMNFGSILVDDEPGSSILLFLTMLSNAIAISFLVMDFVQFRRRMKWNDREWEREVKWMDERMQRIMHGEDGKDKTKAKAALLDHLNGSVAGKDREL